MAHFHKPQKKIKEDKVVLGDGIVNGIVVLALKEVPYAELFIAKGRTKPDKNAVEVHFDKDGVHIDVIVKVHFSQSISDMAFKIQEAIRHNVESMTDYHVSTINVKVKGVLFNEIPVSKIQDVEKNEPATENVEEDSNNAPKDQVKEERTENNKWEV